MIIEIESYKGDTLLSGKQITYIEFVRQIRKIESDYDRILDNFTALLCRRYGWTVIENNSNPAYIYDRDTEKILRMRGAANEFYAGKNAESSTTKKYVLPDHCRDESK